MPRARPRAQAARPAPRWKYDKGGEQGNRRKHAWENPYAGFMRVDGKWVGKCPSTVAAAVRETRLNEGVEVRADPLTLEADPARIYVVHDGVVYRAKATNPTAGSWHAFPEFPEELQALPREVWERILSLARAQGCEQGVLAWRAGRVRKSE